MLHEAADEGTVAGRNAAHFPQVERAARSVPMALVFTDPPLAVVGDTPFLDDRNHVAGKASYADQARARTMARNVGRAHIYADRATGRITGATLEEGLKSALRDICRASGAVAPGRSEASMTGG